MRTTDFDFDLPEELIAQFPPAERGASRLLTLNGRTGEYCDRQFADLPQMLTPGDLLVFNDTKVIKARLYGSKDSGGKIEILVERILSDCQALVHIRASHAPRPGSRLWLAGQVPVEVVERRGALFLLAFPGAVLELLDRLGEVPLPPYIERAAAAEDENRYQTVYARHPGAVAAPTAGLHFDEAMLERLRNMGVGTAFVTLHVGAGTFQPVRVEDIAEHHMHSEWYHVPEATKAAIDTAHTAGRRVLAVGTTSLRALEGAAADGELKAGYGDTDIFITPGYRFRVADRLLTNFHLPKSTLMMLVSAFAGYEHIFRAYRHAVDARYRFFSYGDAMLLDRQD